MTEQSHAALQKLRDAVIDWRPKSHLLGPLSDRVTDTANDFILSLEKEQPATVSGRILNTTIAEFERRCGLYLADEQKKPSPDSCLIGLLCEAVRLAREYCDAMKPSEQSAAGKEEIIEYETWKDCAEAFRTENAALREQLVAQRRRYKDELVEMHDERRKREAEIKALREEVARLRKGLSDIKPFVLEEYYPECATPEFKAAVEQLEALLPAGE
jgi:hypothetical protein